MIEQKNKEEIFLITTALEESWDTSKHIVFLGNWCRRYSRKQFWEKFNSEVLINPWSNIEKAEEAYYYINEIYNNSLTSLTEILNNIHKVNYNKRYWQIIIGPWLQLYINTLYDRYILIKSAIEIYPNFTTIGLSAKSFVTPKDTLDFAELLKNDLYNYQIYTKILTFFNIKFDKKEISNSYFNTYKSNKITKVKIFIKKSLDSVFNIAKLWQKHPVIIISSYFSGYTILNLFTKTNGNVIYDNDNEFKLPGFQLNYEMRNTFQNLLYPKNEFENLIKFLIPFDIPQCFIEGFDILKREANNRYKIEPKAIFSANAWYFDEIFKSFAAKCSEKKIMLIGTQHGGNYGGALYMPFENHETAITDRYYSWGWKRTDCRAKLVPFASTKLSGRKQIGANNKKDGILFVSTSMPRYLSFFPSTPDEFNDYLICQSKFVKSLSLSALSALRVRLHREDLGWDIEDRWKDNYPDVYIERWNVPFFKSLKNCRLFVCDHFSTTFAESLAANKPTILFWNPKSNKLRPEAEAYYYQLKAAGILYYFPEEAALAVNTIYGNVEAWWYDLSRQTAIQSFCKQFARSSSNSINEWTLEFRKILKGNNEINFKN